MIMLKLTNVTKNFNGKKILNHVHFEFKDGNIYVIRGESGSGKTTLLNIIAGYIHADEGEVERAGDLKIEYLFQDDMLFSNLTVQENLYIKYAVLHPDAAGFEKTAHDVLRSFHIIDLIDRKVSMLSGGEKRRVQLANVFMSNPDIVLMDEPTSKLDAKNRKSILDAITHAFRNKLVIIVSHENDQMPSNSIHLKLVNGSLQYE